jgi:hypothetical protein
LLLEEAASSVCPLRLVILHAVFHSVQIDIFNEECHATLAFKLLPDSSITESDKELYAGILDSRRNVVEYTSLQGS